MYTTQVKLRPSEVLSKFNGYHVYYTESEIIELGYHDTVKFPISGNLVPKVGKFVITTNNYALPILQVNDQLREVVTCFGRIKYDEYYECPCLPIVHTMKRSNLIQYKNFADRFVRTFDFNISYETVYNKKVDVNPVVFINQSWVNYYIGKAMMEIENTAGISYKDLFDLRKKQLSTTNAILEVIKDRINSTVDSEELAALVDTATKMIGAQEIAYSGASAPMQPPDQHNIQINNNDKAVNAIGTGKNNSFPTMPESKQS